MQNRYPPAHNAHSATSQPNGAHVKRGLERRSLRLVASLVAAIGGGGLCLLIGGFLAAYLTYTYFQVTGRIIPGVLVGDARVGGMTIEQAAIEIHKSWNLEKKLMVSDGIQSWMLTPGELGLSVEPQETAKKAYGVTYGRGPFKEVSLMLESWRNGKQILPMVALDPGRARAGLEALDKLASKPPEDAGLAWDGQNLAALPAEIGYAVNIEATLQVLEADPQGILAQGYLKLALMPLLPQLEDVSASLAEAQRLLNLDFPLKAYDPVEDQWFVWDVPRTVKGSWLQIKPGEKGPEVGIDESQVGVYLESINGMLPAGRYIDAGKQRGIVAQAFKAGWIPAVIVSHRPSTYVVQAGDTLLMLAWRLGMPYWMIIDANPGMDSERLVSGQSLVVPSKDELLPLQVVLNKRVVLSISQQRLWVYQDGQEIRKFVISTGVDRSPTQPGVFQVQTHVPEAYASVWDLYMPNFLGIYEAWPGFMNGIHGLPTLSSGRRLWASILGKPASYGCIILGLDEAEWLYTWAENGVVVEIRP